MLINNLNEIHHFIQDEDFTICGIDEAGRGPIAGPIVITGLVFNKNLINNNLSNKSFINKFNLINDSKLISPELREKLYHFIKEISHNIVIKVFSNEYIDRYGLSSALSMGIEFIFKSLKKEADIFLFDGKYLPSRINSRYKNRIFTMVKADSKVKEVAAASIISKVIRDKIMLGYSKLYPQYRFEKHKGYPTKAHIEAVLKLGYSPIHRKSFKIKRTLF